jgi:hypothetical protein
MKKKLLNFLTRWQAASKIMSGTHYIVCFTDDKGDDLKVAHSDVPVEGVRRMIGYLNIKTMIDYDNDIK